MPRPAFAGAPLRRTAGLVLALATATLVFFAWQQFYPVRSAEGWSYRALHTGVAKAAALALDGSGDLLVSEELNDGQGRILRIGSGNGRSVVVDGLSKPDGLVATAGGVAFSQEGGEAPVSLLENGAVTPLFTGTNVQGLWLDPGRALYAIEDRKGDGRLLRFDLASHALTTLRDRLTEAVSITGCPDGRLFYTEKSKGLVRQLTDDGQDPPLLSGLHEPSFLLCDGRGLWVSEDSTHRARLLLLGPDGTLNTILSYLKAPQALLPLADGKYLLAEGGRNRVLEISVQ